MKEAPNKCDCEKCDVKEMFYKNVEAQYIEIVCNTKIEKAFKKGDMIIEEGKPIESFIYLKSGLVKLYKQGEDEKGQIIIIAKPFDFVNLLSVFSDTNYNYSVTALEDSVTCHLDLDHIKNMIRTNGEFALSVMKKISKVSDTIILESLTIRKKNIHGRVAYILLFFADQIYEDKYFELPLNRREIAEFIGKTTENVIRTLSEFRRDGLIKIFGKSIEIIDKEKLQQVSDFG
ncbi:MAG: Crp/Fnr family transcriptional regulator, partial [Bacteroidales bacterium]|nr:Crp/Fnr family transcriptional regulator [Bacteroidales bacterium]